MMVAVAARVAAVARVAAAARIAAAGRVAKLGEQLSTVQPLRGVVVESEDSDSGKSSEVGGATLCSTTTERGGDGERGEWQVTRGDGSTLECTMLGR